MNKLEKWSEELTKEVYNEWKTKYSFWKSGFKIFYSPVRKNPKLSKDELFLHVIELKKILINYQE